MGTGEDEPGAGLCRVLIERLRSLEASYERLRNQFRYATSVGVRVTLADRDVTADVGLGYLKYYNLKNPYRSILDSMGHALYVSSPDSHEIIYWNLPASKLYGWNDYEVIGERVTDLLIDEEFYGAFNKIMEELRAGKSWSGQFPLKKRSGKIFMAIVTKSPLYEGGELTGIVTVSSDDSVHNSMNSRANLRAYQGRGNAQSSLLGSDLKRIQRHAHPQIAIASVPQIASSVSNLTSKVLPSKPGNSSCQVAGNGDSEQTPPKIKDTSDNFRPFVGKVLSKFHVGRSGNSDGRRDGNGHLNGSVDTSVSRESRSEENVLQDSKIAPIYYDSILKETRENALESKLNSKAQDVQRYETPSRSPVLVSKECPECFSQPTLEYIASHGSHFGLSDSKPLVEDLKAEAVEHLVRRPPDVKKDPSFGELISNGDEGDDESNAKIDYEICWEDLKVGEQLGQGSCAIVHRGIWNGSDVAIKVFLGYDCHEGTLADYRKEINIMRRLRHPNVLLYMGAVSSQERLAIVTEYLPRGSLFKTIHKNSPGLDIKRHLRMALDAAKGMNYLHCRNPPIVHRDLKTSNLLVGKNWTVKVGDFGLSKMKHTTFLTAKSGRGTPQWMAPEVLRNEPSNEKSDVFSFGVILWELMTQSIPWGNLNALQVVGVVGFMDRRLQLPEDIDPQISSLISECWQSDPQKRPSFQEIIKIMVRVIRRFASTTQTESEP